MSARVAELEALIRRTMAAAEDATGEDRPWLVAQADTLARERDRLVEQRRDPAPRGGAGESPVAGSEPQCPACGGRGLMIDFASTSGSPVTTACPKCRTLPKVTTFASQAISTAEGGDT